MTTATNPGYTLPACPAWCVVGEGHDFDTVGPANGEMWRHHHSAAHLDWSQIVALETMLDSVATREAPYISVSCDVEEMNAKQAAELLAALSLALRQLDEINGAAK
jgi:hypothetical protein